MLYDTVRYHNYRSDSVSLGVGRCEMRLICCCKACCCYVLVECSGSIANVRLIFNVVKQSYLTRCSYTCFPWTHRTATSFGLRPSSLLPHSFSCVTCCPLISPYWNLFEFWNVHSLNKNVEIQWKKLSIQLRWWLHWWVEAPSFEPMYWTELADWTWPSFSTNDDRRNVSRALLRTIIIICSDFAVSL